jgi:hypothetical protein
MKLQICVPFALAGALVLGLVSTAMAQPQFDRGRQLVEQTDRDLHKVEHVDRFSSKDRERYDNALHHLSEFDSGLSRGKHDQGKLDAAIDDVNNICKNNTLSPNDRDVLQDDLRALRELRAGWLK